MYLSEMKFDEIPAGLEVLSAIGNPGKVLNTFQEGSNGCRENTIHIKWTYGAESSVFHTQADFIKVL